MKDNLKVNNSASPLECLFLGHLPNIIVLCNYRQLFLPYDNVNSTECLRCKKHIRQIFIGEGTGDNPFRWGKWE